MTTTIEILTPRIHLRLPGWSTIDVPTPFRRHIYRMCINRNIPATTRYAHTLRIMPKTWHEYDKILNVVRRIGHIVHLSDKHI